MSKLMYIALQAIGQYNTGDQIPVVTNDELEAAVKDGKSIEGLLEARAEFLLSKGAIKKAEAEDDTDNGDGGEVVQLDKLTKADLIDLLNEEGIEYDESNTKAELIALFPKD